METFKKYLKNPGLWINTLLGRPVPVEIPKDQVTHQETQSENKTPATQNTQSPQGSFGVTQEIYGAGEDPLRKDLASVKNIFSKITSKVHKVSEPIVSKGQEVAQDQVAAGSAFVKTDRFKKIIPLIVFLIVLFILAVIVVAFLSRRSQITETPVVVTDPTPSPVPFTPSQPSIYSTDEEILKLEEDITVLDREIAGTALRETTLNPPSLDFEISFK